MMNINTNILPRFHQPVDDVVYLLGQKPWDPGFEANLAWFYNAYAPIFPNDAKSEGNPTLLSNNFQNQNHHL